MTPSCSCIPADVPLYAGILLPFLLIYFFNWLLFLIILINICRHDRERKITQNTTTTGLTVRKDLKKYFVIVSVLSVNFGLGWAIGLFSPLTEVVVYIFSIFVAIQGILIFFFHALRVDEARKTWKLWFYIIFCCKSVNEAKQETRATSATPYNLTPYVKRKMIKKDTIYSSHEHSFSFQKYLEPDSSEIDLSPIHGISETDTRDTFIPDINDQEYPPPPDYTVIDTSKNKRLSSIKDEKRSGSKKRRKKPRRDVLAEEKTGVQSMYSVGEVSMESQALEIEFEPESGSDNEENWKELQQTLHDIDMLVHGSDTERNTIF